jgi:hypothetical protein
MKRPNIYVNGAVGLEIYAGRERYGARSLG